MADAVLTLQDEKRRRLHTGLMLGGALMVSTLFVSNERALFVPIDDPTIPNPVAYAVTMQTGGGGANRTSSARSKGFRPSARAVRVPRNPRNPVAYGVRIPPGTPDAADFAPIESVLPAGNGIPIAFNSPPELRNRVALDPFPDAARDVFVPQASEAAPAVPEPSAWVMMAFGLWMVGAVLRRNRRGSVEDQAVAGDRDGAQLRQGVLAE